MVGPSRSSAQSISDQQYDAVRQRSFPNPSSLMCTEKGCERNNSMSTVVRAERCWGEGGLTELVLILDGVGEDGG